MSLPQQPTFETVSQTMLQGIVDAICDRPGESAAQRDARSSEVVCSVQSFAPRDAVELMLAGMAVIHAHLIHDAVRELSSERDNQIRARTKSSIVSLDRGMMGFLRHLRIVQKRPLKASEINVEAAPDAVPVPSATEVIAAAVTTTDIGRSKPPAALHKPAPEPPVPLLPPSRPDRASSAAMMAMLSPPTRPLVPRSHGTRAAIGSPHGHGVDGAMLTAGEAVLAANMLPNRGVIGHVAPVLASREADIRLAVATR